MKLFISAAAAVLALSSCLKEPEVTVNPADKNAITLSVRAQVEALRSPDPSTKTYIDTYQGTANTILWGTGEYLKLALTAGDATVFANSTDASADAFDGAPEATFTFSVSPEAASSYTYQALYPASAAVASDNDNPAGYKVTLPAIQNATASSYDPAAYIMVAKPETFDAVQTDWEAYFCRGTALNKVTLKNLPEDIVSVEFSSSNKAFAGSARLNLATGAFDSVYEGSESIKVSYATPLSGSSIDVWFTSWDVAIAAGEKLLVVARSASASYTREVTASDKGISFKVGYLNTLSIDMASAVAEYTPVTGIALKNNVVHGLHLFEPVGNTLDLKPYITLTPANASFKGVTFSSDNAGAASVDENGIVTCNARGNNVTITVASKADAGVSASILLRTSEAPSFAERTQSDAVFLHNCDNTNGFTTDGRNVEIVTSGQKEGSGWYKSTTQTAEIVILNLSGLDVKVMAPSRAHLSFWFYVEDAETFRSVAGNAANDGRTEIGNAGGKGLYWPSKDVFADLQEGWNHIDLAIKDAIPYGADPYVLDPSDIRWFRIYFNGGLVGNTAITWGIDDIKVYESFAETTAEKKYLLHPTFDEYRSHNVGDSNWCPSEQALGALFASGGPGAKMLYFVPQSINTGATIANGHLHFKWYISDITKLNFPDSNGQVELSSAGTSDQQELTFVSDKFLKYCQSGWNDVVLDFNRNDGNGGLDLSAVNWFRFYDDANGDGAEMIKDIYVYSE